MEMMQMLSLEVLEQEESKLQQDFQEELRVTKRSVVLRTNESSGETVSCAMNLW